MFIELKNVSKKIKGAEILKNVSLKINNGICCGFVGRNGCGKTMLLRAICGFMKCDGDVFIDGRKIGEDISFINNAGIIIGETTFIGSMTGFENLKILSEIQKIISEEQIKESLRAVGLESSSDKKYRKYSLGMKQRLRIAQAIMENPNILILDEPFNGLDKNGCEEISILLEEYKKQGKTILITSHNDEDIKRLCDKTFEMDKGEIIAEVDLNEK